MDALSGEAVEAQPARAPEPAPAAAARPAQPPAKASLSGSRGAAAASSSSSSGPSMDDLVSSSDMQELLAIRLRSHFSRLSAGDVMAALQAANFDVSSACKEMA